jgi:dihydrofolate reductase / thymidylate synthase
MFKLIIATDLHFGISLHGEIPWSLPEDLHHFRHKTMGQRVIMGRKTWDSLPSRPLLGRVNIVLTSQPAQLRDGDRADYIVENASQLRAIMEQDSEKDNFCIGGASLLDYMMQHFQCTDVFWTKHRESYNCDLFVKSSIYSLIESAYLKSVMEIPNATIRHYVIDGQRHPEYQYMELVQSVMDHGEIRNDRTGVGTLSQLGAQMRFDLRRGFPLLTTKRTFFRGIVKELLWFLRGSTDANILRREGVHIWDGNTSRDFLDQHGFTQRQVGDGGPIYGFNFRHFGAEYVDCHTDYSGLGFDQVVNVLHLIRTDPHSRRMLINLWNPAQLDQVVLPACHVIYQFYVSGEHNEYLSCSMYQRSGDLGLGVPFNIASASLMTALFASLTGKIARELVHTIGDAHVYRNHVTALQEQLQRRPIAFPRLRICDREQRTVEDYRYEDFILESYESHDLIRMDMAV